MYKIVEIIMRTNIELNQKLIEKGLKLTNLKTKKELVNLALEELVKKLQRQEILKIAGKVKWEGDLDEMRTDR